jgi:hypothetical protein
MAAVSNPDAGLPIVAEISKITFFLTKYAIFIAVKFFLEGKVVKP